MYEGGLIHLYFFPSESHTANSKLACISTPSSYEGCVEQAPDVLHDQRSQEEDEWEPGILVATGPSSPEMKSGPGAR